MAREEGGGADGSFFRSVIGLPSLSSFHNVGFTEVKLRYWKYKFHICLEVIMVFGLNSKSKSRS